MTPDYASDFLCHDQKIILPLFVQAVMLEHNQRADLRGCYDDKISLKKADHGYCCVNRL